MNETIHFQEASSPPPLPKSSLIDQCFLKTPNITTKRGREGGSRDRWATNKTPATKLSIQNTPTPIQNQRETLKISNAMINTNNRLNLIVPNTPCIQPVVSSLTNKVMGRKRLHNLNNDFSEDLPGFLEQEQEVDQRQQARPKASSLFKPKATLMSNNAETGPKGVDLSYETLKKRERRRKLVVRLSELSADELKAAPPPLPPPIANPLSSEIVCNKDQDKEEEEDSTTLSPPPANQHYDPSFTKVSIYNETTEQSSVLTDSQCYDLILFDGLKLTSPHSKSSIKRINFSKKLSDKTNTTKLKSKSLKPLLNTEFELKRTTTRPFNVTGLTTTTKHMNISFMGLDEETHEQMTSAIRDLKNIKQNSNVEFKVRTSEEYNQRTTHLIIDCKLLFDENEFIGIKEKCVLLLAALNKCKLIRVEWLKRCRLKGKWIDEDKYLLENYIDQNLSSYDQDQFDVKLIGFLRQLPQNIKFKRNLFSGYKNLYVMEEIMNSDADESESNENNQLCNSWFSFKSNTTYDYLTELLTKCGACLTSRVALAELVVTIDKTNDYDTDTSHGERRLEQDRSLFKDAMNDLTRVLRKKQDGIMVVSSDWVIDTLVEDSCHDLKEFEITCLSTSF
jgi:hypothetical protein